MKNFDKVIPLLLKDEGGYSNDPADSGGETNFGITQRETDIPVRTMTVGQAKAIYKEKYWDALGCDTLDNGVDYTVFDYGVNSGIGRPRAALKKFADKKGADLINAINDERQAFLNNLAIRRPKDQKFLRGWTSRVARVRAYSLDMNKSIGGHASAGAGGAIVAGGTAMAVTPHTYWPWIIGGIAIACVIAGGAYLIHKYNKV